MVEAVLVLQIAVALVLLIAAWAKLGAAGAFAASLVGSGVPGGLSIAVARTVIVLELATGAALIIAVAAPELRTSAAVTAALLSLGFFGFAAIAIAQGRRGPCFCFGRDDRATVGWATATRAVFMAAASVIVAASPTSPLSANAYPPLSTIGAGLGVLLVMLDLIWGAFEIWRTPVLLQVPTTRRISLRHVPLDVSLFDVGTPLAPQRNALTPEGLRGPVLREEP